MYLVFDTGGTKMRMAASSDGKTLEEKIIIPTPHNFKEAMEIFARQAKILAKNRPIQAVAGGVPGALNPEHSMIIKALNMPGWVNQPLKQELEIITGAPVLIENDTTVYGLAEANHGQAKEKDIVVYLGIGTGIGGKRFVKGKPEPSAFGFEPGYQIIDVPPFAQRNDPDIQKKTGYLEMLVGGNGLHSRFGKAAEHIDNPEIWDEIAFYLAAGLNNVTVFWSPDLIILGGSVMKDIPLAKVRTYLQKLNPIFTSLPELTLAEFGEIGGLMGALIFLATPR